ncbi:MAG: hypothetical protein A2654_01135 [Candidatus Nealsonbacteria bacterium RIFCSPHIGHO2_01_FULL_43_31]|uniref:Uncharacterized protein n=2 Tax=Candidatus Nealsoniibacteriota TaxID=1817911 RepID=A0A1G2E9C0_9BACT|nr:MAG: hypothetical protein UV98_C0021G0013 [Parcubacteria group bacterium GW2011_GWB1_43_6]OGZ20269.1 MAG: hypothetical protein A2654_01135 [Candidatus Nealsonbacteria bacterium RIFCSPHIGHO2_01_FULL_43_31]OGZ21870.1 MAG: hypothetical protein A3D46_02605 [Candidatus Nealsonbacteria bacterium RIFCSPHIGHO2_02_FULL_43_13]OGZ24803.1 MAG: hypothetical protein A2922_00130 [Candidatus Nealsonbacteria bacterium RIFCSPLOWO2_01_FULL_43_36]
MLCAVVGKKYLWFFCAPNKTEGIKRANIILSFDEIGTGNVISNFDLRDGYWEAVARKPDDVKDLIEKIDKAKIIEIKRRRILRIDVLYVTRLQKERW